MSIPDGNDSVIESINEPSIEESIHLNESLNEDSAPIENVLSVDITKPAFNFAQTLRTFYSKAVKASRPVAEYVRSKTSTEKEVQIAEFLKVIESKIDLKDAKDKIKEIEASSKSQDYENKVRRCFEEGVCNVTIVAEKDELTQIPDSLGFGIEIFNFMGEKLQESALVKNIEYMTVTSTLEKNEVIHLVEFELKVSGQRWSTIFSKFISKEIFQKLEWADGKIDGHYMNNVTLIRETFILIFSHTRLELLKNEEKVENVFMESHKEINQDI
jgi:hypothetical protein